MAKRTIQNDKEAPVSIDRQHAFYGIRLDEEQLVFANAIWSSDYDIIFCNAKAGTGKTVISTGVALMLLGWGKFKDVYYIISPYAEKKQGFLPGTIDEKSSVYFQPFYQALSKCRVNINTDVKSETNQSGHIICETDTFLRGQTIEDSVIIIDEAQNFTVSQLKKVLTRVGDNTKVIVIGHNEQCDIENEQESGFLRYIEHFRGQDRAFACSLTTNHRGWVSQWADEL